jgi:hypothetical protein
MLNTLLIPYDADPSNVRFCLDQKENFLWRENQLVDIAIRRRKIIGVFAALREILVFTP